MENWRDMFSLVAMLLLAGATASSSIAGTLSTIGPAAAGASLAIARPGGAIALVIVAPGALVRERATGGHWRVVSLAALKAGEPVTAVLDASGTAHEIDAEYALVSTRAVTAQGSMLVGTDGVVYTLVDAAATAAMPLGAYVELKTDPATGVAFDAEVSAHPFAQGGKEARDVAVTFDVRVPINTPPSSTIYLATNAQNWTANAIRLSPEPGNRWTATIEFAAGTVLQFKYTRGSWVTGERDAAGAQIPNRTITVTDAGSVQREDDVVVRWADLPS